MALSLRITYIADGDDSTAVKIDIIHSDAEGVSSVISIEVQ